MTLYLDLSQLVADPRRSGIQRVERELLRHWPADIAMAPCRFDAATGLCALAPGVLDILCRDAPAGGIEEERSLLATSLADPGRPVPRGSALLCAELFVDPARAAYLIEQAAHTSWLVHDLLPWRHPEWFPAGAAIGRMPFLHALRRARRWAYVSAPSKRDAVELILGRPCDGPVLPLGADGIGLERQRFDPGRRDIVLLGTVEPRKNAIAALEACRSLWAQGAEFRLIQIGRVEPDAAAEIAMLRALGSEQRLVQLGPVPDAALRDALRQARALLFPSLGEGYGLPPVEALAAGIPVIVAASLPALEGLPGHGQIRLAVPDAPAIAAALRDLLDDGAARRLWGEAGLLRLPTWREFSRSVADWAR